MNTVEPPSAHGLVVDGISVSFEARVVVDNVDLAVGHGELVCMHGPSGSGKSTLLAVIAGLVRPDAGSVRFEGRDLTRVPPHRRNVGMVFQRHALFPHLDVADNVGFGLRMAGVPAVDRARRTAALLAQVDLTGFDRRRVSTLSGGEAQRVALARALAPEPSVMLFDEPLSSLDAELRVRLGDDIRRIVTDAGTTALYVTHDPAEAERIGDRVVNLIDLRRPG